MRTAVATRRTQEERRTVTRGRILDAALECLAKHGYAGTTTTAVAERAGVSRGAELHHFPTRADLIAGAVQHLFAGLVAEYEGAFAALRPATDRVAASIDLLWRIHHDPRLVAVLELHVAGRTDPELRRALAPVAREHHARVIALAGRHFPAVAAAPRFAATIELVLDTLQGLAVRRLFAADDADTAATLALLKDVATGLVRTLQN